ncbi:hypothetical protein Sfulv_06620 [Streptomyces fulvorobeus]|uniref:Uncharacterized protein n=1 Tax=Streptomyces fulvorobeus TaxID=284028 RepID=A0A7J0C049_9ACTN|nr:hypothetical protein Sfulv_06620 [Streptomyces fulvorobeus]
MERGARREGYVEDGGGAHVRAEGRTHLLAPPGPYTALVPVSVACTIGRPLSAARSALRWPGRSSGPGRAWDERR